MHILLADPQPRVRFALRILLEQQAGWSVVGEAQDAAEMLRIARDCRPDLVLLDGSLPGLSCAEHLPALRANAPGVIVVALNDLPCIHPDNPFNSPAHRPDNRSTGAPAAAAQPAGAAFAARPDATASKANPPEHLLAVLRGCLKAHARGASVHPKHPT